MRYDLIFIITALLRLAVDEGYLQGDQPEPHRGCAMLPRNRFNLAMPAGDAHVHLDIRP